MVVKRHTTLNLDIELVEQAREALGTTETTETIHRALQEIVNRDKRRRLLEMGIGDLTPQRLEAMRKNRLLESSEKPSVGQT